VDTFDVVLQRGIAANDATALDAWITRTCSLATASEHPFAANFASRTLQWWLRAKSTLKYPRALLYYVLEYRLERVGRLFPELFDAEIAQRAMNMHSSGLVPPGLGASADGTGRADGTHAKSVSEMTEKMNELLTSMGKMASTMDTVAGRVRGLSDRVGEVEKKAGSPGGPNKGRKCHKCGSTDHLVANCPEKEDE